MTKKLQKANIACVEVPLWDITHGPHYDDLQRILESFWIPDMSSSEHLLLQYDLIIVPDPTLAKYLVEAYYDKEQKVDKKRKYYDKLMKQYVIKGETLDSHIFPFLSTMVFSPYDITSESSMLTTTLLLL